MQRCGQGVFVKPSRKGGSYRFLYFATLPSLHEPLRNQKNELRPLFLAPFSWLLAVVADRKVNRRGWISKAPAQLGQLSDYLHRTRELLLPSPMCEPSSLRCGVKISSDWGLSPSKAFGRSTAYAHSLEHLFRFHAV